MESSNGKENRAFIGIARACAVLAAGFGFCALLGWIADIPLLATLGPGVRPMAPSSALLFMLYGILFFMHAPIPESYDERRRGFALGSFCAILSLTLLVLSALGIESEAEHLGIRITGMLEGAPIGHMSPLSASCFVLAGASFLFMLSSFPDHHRRATAALFFGCIILAAGIILTTAYLLTTPLLYGSGVIPPSLSTSLAFMMLGTAFLLYSARLARPRDWLSNPADMKATYVLILIFIFSSAAIIAAGYFSFRNYQKDFRAQVERQLSAIADLKVSELVQWRKERLGDASVFYNNGNFSDLVRRFLEDPQDREMRDRIFTWLHKVYAAYQYDRVFLLDAHGVERASAPDVSSPADSHLTLDTAAVLRSGWINFLDFHREAPDRPIHLLILIPVFDEKDGGRALGILGLRINPETYLYPLIKRWPASSRTAETLLVRRDGNDVLYLNELRFKENAALSLREPLDNQRLPAAKAVLGQEGVVDGIDYRGMPVVAALRAIPDSPWYMVARIDAAEVYAPLQERLWTTMGLIGAMLLGAGAILGFLWRNQRAGFYRERYMAAEELRESRESFQRLVENAPDGIFVHTDGRLAYVNEAAVRLLGGERPEDVIGDEVLDHFHPDCQAMVRERLGLLYAEKQPASRVEEVMAGLDGRFIDVEVSSVPFRFDGKDGALAFVRDVTARKKAQNRITHLNQVLRAIRSVNQLIVREKDREQLIRKGCRLLVEHRSYTGAMIVLTDENDRPAAYAEAGMGETFAPLAEMLDRRELPPCCRLAGQTGDVVLVSEREIVCSSCVIGQQSVDSSTLCVRLAHGGVTFGYLVVTLAHSDGVVREEQDLFAEMAADLSYALHTIMNQKAREKAEQARQALEGQLLQAQKMEAVGRLAGGVAHDFNNMLQTILGYSELMLDGLDPRHPFHENLEEVQKAAQRSADLTRQLLAFSRKQTIAPKVLDLNDTITAMLKMLGRLIGEDIDLFWKPAHNLWPVKMDPAQIDQILANLVVNARDAISGIGKVTIETGKAVFDEAYCANHVGFISGRYVMLAVSDDGSGMDRTTLSHIFEPFFTTKPQGQGTGLGLATVYGIVKQNKGFINVYSEPEKGTTFKIYLSAYEAEATAELKREIRGKRTGTETVLLVEDEDALLQLGKMLLEHLGYTVMAADAPGKALQLAEEYDGVIHLLMTDVVMPEMSGRELWRHLSALRPSLKCLFMSGYTANVITHHGVLDKGVHFLQKPFSREDLAAKLREALED